MNMLIATDMVGNVNLNEEVEMHAIIEQLGTQNYKLTQEAFSALMMSSLPECRFLGLRTWG